MWQKQFLCEALAKVRKSDVLTSAGCDFLRTNWKSILVIGNGPVTRAAQVRISHQASKRDCLVVRFNNFRKSGCCPAVQPHLLAVCFLAPKRLMKKCGATLFVVDRRALNKALIHVLDP